MSFTLSTCVLLISFMQLVNGAQFLNITFLLVLFASASAAAVLLKSDSHLPKKFVLFA